MIVRYFYTKLNQHIEALNRDRKQGKRWTMNRIARLSDIPSGHFSLWKKPKDEGGRFPTDTEVKKIASIAELGIPEESLWAWKMLDEYTPEKLRAALELSSDWQALSEERQCGP